MKVFLSAMGFSFKQWASENTKLRASQRVIMIIKKKSKPISLKYMNGSILLIAFLLKKHFLIEILSKKLLNLKF